METILLATDFSPAATNAAEYAAELAKRTDARLLLFHAYHVPVASADIAPVVPAYEDWEEMAMEGLVNLGTDIRSRHDHNLIIDYKCSMGLAVDEIKAYTAEHKTQLIVMGMRGAGFISEKLIGSVATALIRQSTCPVLVVDENVRFRIPKRIVLACDENSIQPSLLSLLRTWALQFKSHVYVLHVVSEHLPEIMITPMGPEDFEETLEGIPYSIHQVSNSNTIEGINSFVKKENIDMLVMIPRKHSFFHNLFNEPITKKAAFHSLVPLLTIHE